MPPQRPAMLIPPPPLHLLPTHPPITISTQNVGVMRGEFKLKKGPKLSMIRKIITSATDFLVLSEIGAQQQAIMNTKLKYNLQPSHFSTSQHPRGGVLIFANQRHKKMEGSERLSASMIREASNIVAELKLLYITQHVIAAGDFNAVLEPEGSSSQEIGKRTTSAALHSMIDRHHLIDLARKSNKLEHTWLKIEITSQ
jgi:hypothetical protein